MFPKIYLCFVLCVTAVAIRAANILVFMPMPFKSHFRGFQPLFEELSHRGHNVTVASQFRQDGTIANYTDIGPFVSFPRERNVMDVVNMNFVTSVMSTWNLGEKLSKIMSNKNLQKFIRSNSNTFDLVMVESCFQEYTVVLGHKFNAPVIFLTPAMMWSSVSKWLHVPSSFSYIPNVIFGRSIEMDFVERLKNTVTGAMQLYAEDYFDLPHKKAIMNALFTYEGWELRPPLEKMLSDVSLTLVNAHHAVGVPRPYLPGVIEVGGMHIKRPKPLPENLKTYLDSAEYGVVYFSFGSVVNLNHLPKEKLNIFLNVIGKLKQKVMLKWKPNGNVNLPKNIMLGQWFPQNDILAHPNVRLFITHGGFHSLEESVYHAKPVVGVPIFGDQYLNMKVAEQYGYGKLINILDMTEELFENAINEVLSNPTFKEKVKIQSQVYQDQPMKPLDRAVYWVEYVIRHDGAKHLKSQSIGLSDIEYFLFDIALLFFIPFGFTVWFCYLFTVKVISKLLNSMWLFENPE